MPVRQVNRDQTWLLPPSLDELLPADHPARFVSSVIDNLGHRDWEMMGIGLEGDALGAPRYHPRALLAVWLYGFMTRTRSSRRLEEACRDEIPYLWLTGWQRPDHNTLWRFYKQHRDQMRHLFKLSVKTAVRMDLVDMAVQAVDGTKMAANASKHRTYDKDGLGKLLARAEKVIQQLEEENEKGEGPSPIHLPEKLRQAEELKAQVKRAMEQLAEEESKRINLTDSDAELVKNRQGIVAGYNMEAVVSPLKEEEAGRKGRIITAVDVFATAADYKLLIPMLDQAEETTEKRADVSLADAGFHSGANLAACEERNQAIVMPDVQDRQLVKPYHKDKFIYDAETDSYTCPYGQTLSFVKTKKGRNSRARLYRCSETVCRECPALGECTKSKGGRQLQIGGHEAELRRHREWMVTEEAQAAYKKRKGLIEGTFGIIKAAMGIQGFLLRGLTNVRAEAAIIATAFNLRTLYSVWRLWSLEKRRKLGTVVQG